MNGYGEVALGVECALPADLDLRENRGGGRADTGKEDRDTDTALPACFGMAWWNACRRLCW